jgi:hypothetical protein
MFGALNRFIGRLDAEPSPQPRNGPGDNAFGFQILRNKDSELPLEPWFDFIVGINGHLLVRKADPILRLHANQAGTLGRPRPESVCHRSSQLRRRKRVPRYLERKGCPVIPAGFYVY